MIPPSSIASVYNAYMEHLYAYALHLGFEEEVAMDAIHDVFYKLCLQHSSLEKITNIKFFLFRSLKNRLIDLRRTKREYPVSGMPESEICREMSFEFNVIVEDDLIDQEDREEIKKKVEHKLGQLTDRQREIIYLRYIHEYEYEEIAQLMQISVASCRNLLSKALCRLKEQPIPLILPLLLLKYLSV
ncbi:MAG: sigma-70 family RNA polymerase sigma factor [Proteiniphilum sp.]|nr:sigma-70 family RNA polymerase sigma factor [Proteiniphilum sp.]